MIEGVTESHRRSVAIATGAERRGFVTKRGRDWSEAPNLRKKVETCFYPHTAIHQLRALDALPRLDHLDVGEQVPEVTRGQRRTRHAQLTQAREDSGKLTVQIRKVGPAQFRLFSLIFRREGYVMLKPVLYGWQV